MTVANESTMRSYVVLIALSVYLRVCAGHVAMIMPPPFQDRDGMWQFEPGDGWHRSGVTSYQNAKVWLPDGVAEVIGEESPYRTWCNSRNRHYPGACNHFGRTPWLAPGYAVPQSPCSVFEIPPHTDALALPGNIVPTKWAAGSVVEAAWSIYANHGGGCMLTAAETGTRLPLACPLILGPL